VTLVACKRDRPAPAPVPPPTGTAQTETAPTETTDDSERDDAEHTIAVPAGVTELRPIGIQSIAGERFLARRVELELDASRTVTVPRGLNLAATVDAASPALVAWANANQIWLGLSCRGPLPPRLERLACGDADGPALARLAAMPELTALELIVAPEVTDATLAQLPVLPHLETLDLAFDHVTGAGLQSLRRQPRLTRLRVAGNRIGDAGLATIAGLTGLIWLDVSATDLTDAGVATLATATQLTSLAIGNNDLTDAGIAPLAGLTALESLDLSGTDLTDAGVARLVPLRQLQRLEVEDTAVTAAGCAAVDRARGTGVCVREAEAEPDPHPASTTVSTYDDLEVIDLGPADGPLRDQLLRRFSAAKGRVLLIETTAVWCRPCIGFATYIADPAMTAALAGVTLARIDIDRFPEAALATCGLSGDAVPMFVIVDAKLAVRDTISSDEWDEDIPANMAPVLGAFVRGTLTHRRHP